MGYAEHSNHCKTLGGRVALVSTPEELNAIQTYMIFVGTFSYVRIDGTDAATEGLWMTEAGEPMTFTGFTGLEPNGGTITNCIGITFNTVDDIQCTAHAFVPTVLCEY